MQKVVPLLPSHTQPPIAHLRFLNGLEVLHTPLYAPLTFSHRIARALDALSLDPHTQDEPFTTILEIALGEGLSVSVAREMLAFVEMVPDCGLVRDDQGSAASGFAGGPVEERWYRDLISGFTWVDVNP
jgi:ESCRT-II complex subunit VPS36